MEQIYYTQCPIGYGLGASNGFQIKRLSAGYPVTGDFRHLGLRAFVAGTKALAPPALRYRRDGAVAEVAWLTPRAQEYQTERGLWGRPGGHFAHGLRLSAEEMTAISRWPAGLFDSPIWKRTDPEPTRGRPPDPVELGPTILARPATFAAVAPLAEGENVERLARLLTAVAIAVREGRTVFLIDEADRLGPRMMLLTFAFPEALRPAVTLSTYHDRPEELPGFRLQGTTPSARPNRPALAGLGIVADLVAGTFEPAVAPTAWARTLASWLVGRGRGDEEAWSKACLDYASRIEAAGPPEDAWEDDRLDRLFALPALLTPTLAPPTSAEGWAALAGATSWAGTVGLAEEFAKARGPSWWDDAAATGWRCPEARAALLATLALPDAWRGVEGRAWAVPVARWLADAGPNERLQATAAVLGSAPASSRSGLLSALIAALPARAADETLEWLKASPAVDRAWLLPLEVRGALLALLDGRRPEALADLLRLALRRKDVINPVLDALAAEVEGRPAAREALDVTLAILFDEADRLGRLEPLTWALRRSDAEAWLGPHLRGLFLSTVGRDDWRRLRDRAPEELRPTLARAVLHVAGSRSGSDEAFRWGVEELLLPLPESDRPIDPGWPDQYLKRSRSGLELVGKLFVKQTQDPALKRWLLAARAAGELSAEQSGRLEQAHGYARALASRDARELLRVPLPDVPPAERGKVLRQVIEQVGGAKFEQLDLCLDSCRHAWPGAFAPGAPGLDGLAMPLARTLLVYRGDADLWLQCLKRMLLRLELLGDGARGFEPDGLAAHIVAATTRAEGGSWPPWRLRKSLLARGEAWRALAVDAALALSSGPRDAIGAFNDWRDHAAEPATWPRLLELMLNAADGPRLAALVGALAEDLHAIGRPLSWWSRPDDGRDDLRDAFARLAPLAPIDGDLPAVRDWFREFRDLEAADEDDGLAEPPRDWRPQRKLDWSHLSTLGLARWRCIEALSEYRASMLSPADRWAGLSRDESALPLGSLEEDERHRFVGWLVHMTEDCENVSVPRVALFLKAHNVTDADRLGRWPDELAHGGLREPTTAARPDRLKFIGDLKVELRTLLRESSAAPRKARGSP